MLRGAPTALLRSGSAGAPASGSSSPRLIVRRPSGVPTLHTVRSATRISVAQAGGIRRSWQGTLESAQVSAAWWSEVSAYRPPSGVRGVPSGGQPRKAFLRSAAASATWWSASLTSVLLATPLDRLLPPLPASCQLGALMGQTGRAAGRRIPTRKACRQQARVRPFLCSQGGLAFTGEQPQTWSISTAEYELRRQRAVATGSG